MTETFKDALMLSNKTYFLEEITKHKNEKRLLKKENQIYREKITMLERSQAAADIGGQESGGDAKAGAAKDTRLKMGDKAHSASLNATSAKSASLT